MDLRKSYEIWNFFINTFFFINDNNLYPDKAYKQKNT